VLAAQPPLFKIERPHGGAGSAYSDRERDALIRAGTEPGRKLPEEDAIQRYRVAAR
jgi:DNA gyrase subunit B